MLELNATAHRVLRDDDVFAGEIVPIYGATKDLPTRRSGTTIAKNLDRARRAARRRAAGGDRAQARLSLRADAWRDVHAPRDLEEIERGRRRIVFEEFFGVALAAALKRARREAGGARMLEVEPAPSMPAGSQVRRILVGRHRLDVGG